MKHYSAHKWNELPIYKTIGMNLKIIRLSKRKETRMFMTYDPIYIKCRLPYSDKNKSVVICCQGRREGLTLKGRKELRDAGHILYFL